MTKSTTKGTMTMKFNDATEAAYKNGYADGVKATEEKLMLEVRDLRIELKAEREIAKVHKEEIERLREVEKLCATLYAGAKGGGSDA